MRASPLRIVAASSILAAVVASVSAGDAGAASIIKDPHPPQYGLEIEPHLNLNFGGIGFYEYNAFGWGPGVRFSIPVMSPGFIKSINDSIAISFGADLLHYNGRTYFCNGQGGCNGTLNSESFWALYVPVTMQWNFWLTEKWSVMGEPGLAVRHAFVNDNYCDARYYDCRNITTLVPAFYAGGRYHFGDTTALTMRIGFPTVFSIGLSFF